MTAVTESEVEDAALEWLEGLGWEVGHGPHIAPHSSVSERTVYTEVILATRKSSWNSDCARPWPA